MRYDLEQPPDPHLREIWDNFVSGLDFIDQPYPRLVPHCVRAISPSTIPGGYSFTIFDNRGRELLGTNCAAFLLYVSYEHFDRKYIFRDDGNTTVQERYHIVIFPDRFISADPNVQQQQSLFQVGLMKQLEHFQSVRDSNIWWYPQERELHITLKIHLRPSHCTIV